MEGERRQSNSTVDDKCPDWASIGDLFSEESSFHGEGQINADLERRAVTYDPREYWNIHAWNLQCLAAIAAAKLPPRGIKRKKDDSYRKDEVASLSKIESDLKQPSPKAVPGLISNTERPYNPFEGHELSKQLSQSLEDFLVQFPPSTTNASLDHWIQIANPLSTFRPLNENIPAFRKAAQNTLDSYLSKKASLERDADLHINPGVIARKLKPDRDNLERTILSFAKQYGVIKGKWMLFPSSDIVDRVWRSIAQKTLDGTLGCAAKVATRNEDDSRNDQRLLCVYTEDFSNTADVKRVLRELHESKLVVDQRNGTKGGVIYYKCDAYTHLDIVHGNEFKIKASMYNSKDLFAEMRKHGEL